MVIMPIISIIQKVDYHHIYQIIFDIMNDEDVLLALVVI
jgi:hypothetical protein